MGSALRLAAVCPRAAALGLGPGMTLADARARCPDLVTAPDDPEGDARFLAELARRMLRFTPLVMPDPPDGLILDITGAAHLFGSEAALAGGAVNETGLSARHALAGHAAAARALARHGGSDHGRSDVRALPVAALDLPAEATAGLCRAGLFTLGDLAARPLSGIAARFGEEAVRRLRAILGETAQPLTPTRPAAPIRVRASFAEPIARTDDVLDAIEMLLAQAARPLGERGLGGRRFVVTLERCDGAHRRLVVETGLPTRDPAPVMRLFTERIESLADQLDPGFGFDAVRLAVPVTDPLAPRQSDLDGGVAAEDSIVALIDRLSNRLGRERVRRLALRDTHIPEAAQRSVPASAARPSRPSSPVPRVPAPRPLILFDPPQPIAAVAGVPDGPPLRFRWRDRLHEVRLAEGVERIAPEWWRLAEGHLSGHGRTRDYYRVEDKEGRRFWVFRHGLFSETATPDWYIHGLFA